MKPSIDSDISTLNDIDYSCSYIDPYSRPWSGIGSVRWRCLFVPGIHSWSTSMSISFVRLYPWLGLQDTRLTKHLSGSTPLAWVSAGPNLTRKPHSIGLECLLFAMKIFGSLRISPREPDFPYPYVACARPCGPWDFSALFVSAVTLLPKTYNRAGTLRFLMLNPSN